MARNANGNQMTDSRLDFVISSILTAAGAPGLSLPPRALARHLSIPREQAARGLRRAARRDLLAGGRVPA